MTRKPPNHVIAGRYELLEIAGRGGMAVVWRAIDHHHPKPRVVAVKRMLGELSADPSIVALFLEEARVGQTLRHPNIVETIDFGQDDKRSYYLVLEWVDGLDMFEYMRGFHQVKVHVPWQAVALIAHQALHGLAAAHERRDAAGRPLPVIHRDLTPSNILLGINGVVKLADFGLARAMDRSTMTLPHMIKGKLSYTAPEMLHGEKANERTDIYCLGLSLWECLAGKKLFAAGNQIQVLEAVEQSRVPPLAPIRPDAPRPLVATIMRAVSRDPKDRWASAREMNRAIDDLLKSMPDPADPARLGASVRQARDRLKAPPAVGSSVAIRESDNAIEVSAELVVEYASSPSAVRSLDIEISEPFEGISVRSNPVRPAARPKPPPPPAAKKAATKPDPAPRSSTKAPRHAAAGPRPQRSKQPSPAAQPEPPTRPVGLGWPYNRLPKPGNGSKEPHG